MRAMLGLGIFSRALPRAFQGMAAVVGARGYRTSRLTQKMGRKFFKGRGAKSFGYLTTKGALTSQCARLYATAFANPAHRMLLAHPPTRVRCIRPEQNTNLSRARHEHDEGDLPGVIRAPAAPCRCLPSRPHSLTRSLLCFADAVCCYQFKPYVSYDTWSGWAKIAKK